MNEVSLLGYNVYPIWEFRSSRACEQFPMFWRNILAWSLSFGLAKRIYEMLIHYIRLPAQQNKGPEQLPSSNICEDRIILVFKVFNLSCQTYYNKICSRLPTSQQNTNPLQSTTTNKPLTLLTLRHWVSAIQIDIVYLHLSSYPWIVMDLGCGCCFTSFLPPISRQT